MKNDQKINLIYYFSFLLLLCYHNNLQIYRMIGLKKLCCWRYRKFKLEHHNFLWTSLYQSFHFWNQWPLQTYTCVPRFSKCMDIPIIRNKWLGTYFYKYGSYRTPDTGVQVINNDKKTLLGCSDNLWINANWLNCGVALLKSIVR